MHLIDLLKWLLLPLPIYQKHMLQLFPVQRKPKKKSTNKNLLNNGIIHLLEIKKKTNIEIKPKTNKWRKCIILIRKENKIDKSDADGFRNCQPIKSMKPIYSINIQHKAWWRLCSIDLSSWEIFAPLGMNEHFRNVVRYGIIRTKMLQQ